MRIAQSQEGGLRSEGGPAERSGGPDPIRRAALELAGGLLSLLLFTGPSFAGGIFSPENRGTLSPTAGWQIVAGRFLGSAGSDLVAYQSSTGALRLVDNVGSGFQALPTPWITLSPAAGWVLGSGDFTGDGLDDVAGYHPSNGSVWIFRNTGSSFASESRGGVPASANMILHAADFDGNGLADVALYDSATGQVRVGLSTGPSTSAFSLWSTVAPAAGWTFAAADFDGDLRADLAGYNVSTGVVWIGASSGSGFSFSATTTQLSPASGWLLHSGDFTVDGLPDLFAYLPANGTLWVGRNTGSAFDFDPGPWSPSALSPAASWQFAPGDVDLDGELDVAAYHPSNGSLWAMLNRDPAPMGYVWPISGAPGDLLDFMVSGVAAPEVEFYRHTSRGADVTSVLMGTQPFTSSRRAIPPDANRFGCGWPVSFTLTIPSSWPSGLYSARLVGTDGPDWDVPFIVKPPADATPTVAVLANVNTWNAYNDWGGGSKYGGVSRGSFLRPDPYSSPRRQDTDAMHRARAELWVLTWLESQGYQPHLFTDIDFHDGAIGAGYEKLVLSTHPEYFTTEMYDRLAAFVDGGGTLLYIGGNGVYEKATYDSGRRELIFLGGVDGGSRENQLFRRLSPARPERSVLGVATDACDVPPLPFTVLAAGHPIYAGTGVANGGLFGNFSLNSGGGVFAPGRASAWEVDTSAGPGAVGGGCNSSSPPVPPSSLPPGHVVLARAMDPATPVTPGAEVTYAENGNGGKVLAIGSITAGGSLFADAVLPQMIRNLLGAPTAPAVPGLMPIGLGALVLSAIGVALWRAPLE